MIILRSKCVPSILSSRPIDQTSNHLAERAAEQTILLDKMSSILFFFESWRLVPLVGDQQSKELILVLCLLAVERLVPLAFEGCLRPVLLSVLVNAIDIART